MAVNLVLGGCYDKYEANDKCWYDFIGCGYGRSHCIFTSILISFMWSLSLSL